MKSREVQILFYFLFFSFRELKLSQYFQRICLCTSTKKKRTCFLYSYFNAMLMYLADI